MAKKNERKESGLARAWEWIRSGAVALVIWYFLTSLAVQAFRIPSGIKLVRVDVRTGRPSVGAGKGTILEAFKPGTEPSREVYPSLAAGAAAAARGGGATPRAGTGGLY